MARTFSSSQAACGSTSTLATVTYGLNASDHFTEGLPTELAQGAFAKPGTLPAYLRFSTNPGDVLDDKVSTPRGLALKIVGVEGSRLPGSEGQVTQDFVTENAKAFTAATPKAFLKTLKMLAKTTDKAPGMKKALSAALRGVESLVESVGGESATLKSLGGHPQTHILGETFTTVVPILYGPYYAKLAIVPVSTSLTALTDLKVDLKDDPDGLRHAVEAFFRQSGGTWELRVQLATGIEKMPIEDASRMVTFPRSNPCPLAWTLRLAWPLSLNVVSMICRRVSANSLLVSASSSGICSKEGWKRSGIIATGVSGWLFIRILRLPQGH